MTKKHFVALARALRDARPTGGSQEAWDNWAIVCGMVAMTCKKFNPLFNAERFIAACRD